MRVCEQCRPHYLDWSRPRAPSVPSLLRDPRFPSSPALFRSRRSPRIPRSSVPGAHRGRRPPRGEPRPGADRYGGRGLRAWSRPRGRAIGSRAEAASAPRGRLAASAARFAAPPIRGGRAQGLAARRQGPPSARPRGRRVRPTGENLGGLSGWRWRRPGREGLAIVVGLRAARAGRGCRR